MAINFFSLPTANGLWQILGKVYKCQKDINTSRGTTIPNDIVAVINQFNLISSLNPTLTATIQQVMNMTPGYQSGASGSMSVLQQFAEAYMIAVVNLDNPQPDNSLTTALKEIIRQMKSQGKTVKSSAVTISAVAGGSNNGNGVCLVTKKRGDGLVQENTIAETILGVSSSLSLTPNFQFLGQQAVSTQLGQDWPAGSGCSKSVAGIDANQATSQLTNGGFETFTNPNIPDNWLISVGTPGTTLKQTTLEVQRIVVTGTPSAGTYNINYTNPAGKVQSTAPLAYNATGSQVQAALRTLTGLGSVTVATTGTTPNWTHDITFAGAGGDQTQITVTNNTTGGTYTISTPTAGTAQVFAGSYALEFLGTGGATLDTIQQRLSLATDTPYAISLWAICDAAIAAGVVVIDLVDGIGGSVINDDQGVANSVTFNASALTTGWQHLSVLQAAECAFRTPSVLPPLVYLRIRLTTALTNTKNMFIDNVALVAFSELYAGGPFIAVMTGNKAFAAGDTFTITTTNDRAGELREYTNRNMAMDQKELLFPTSATPNIPDTMT